MSILVFDGDCAFCTKSAGFITRRIRPTTDVQAWQSLELESFGLTADQCSTAVQWVSDSGQIKSGAAAITAMLKEAGPGWAALGTIGDLPGIRSVAAGTYRVIAKNRHRLPGSTAACDTSD
jgi:predicted DCC family thiol-disulfide oxidoreductase YuxK